MICFPNAKINIGLNIISRRKDGYHDLETLFYPIGLRDALEIVPVKGLEATGKGNDKRYRLFQTGNPLTGATEENMVVKALNVIAEKRSIPPVDIHLLKKIPSGAGLGGGSSNAAFMLRLLNDTFHLDFNKEELAHMATSLGADCAFFIHNKPSLATGMGERLEPINLNLSRYFLLLVKPSIEVSTKEAYTMIKPKKPELPLKEIIKIPLQEWRRFIKNDFEPSIFKKYPEIFNIKEQLYEMGAIFALMSGSGSSVYGIFEEEPKWQQQFQDHFTWSNKPL